MNVRLEPVTLDNWEEVIKIDLEPEQWAMVDPPSVLHALCECQFYPSLASYAIMTGDTMVGYVAAGRGIDPSWPSPYAAVAILIIDQHHQRRGYGRAAMEAFLAQSRAEGCKGAVITYRVDNAAAKRLYSSLGFQDHGFWEGDQLAWLPFEKEEAEDPGEAIDAPKP